MFRRFLKLSLIVVALAFSAAATGSDRLRVGHDLWIGFSGVFLAKELGYFEDEGLEVDMRGFPGPGDSIPPVISGDLDITLTTLHNLALMAGQDAAPLSAIYFLDASYGGDAIVAKEGIESVKDLKGKNVAVTRNEANHMLLILALESVGMSESDVRIVNMSADNAGAAFLSGRVDAAVTWEPWVSQAENLEGATVIFSTRDAPDTILNTITVHRDTLETSSRQLEGFVRAVDRGVKYLESDREKAVPIIARWLEADVADIPGMLDDDRIYSIAENHELFGENRDGPAMEALTRVIDFLHERKLIESRPALDLITDPSVLREVSND